MSDTPHTPSDFAALAARFVQARLSAEPLHAYPGPQPANMASAYAIQDAALSLWPGDVAGWKIGLVAPAMQKRYEAVRIAGPIFRGDVQSAPSGGPFEFPVFVGGFAAVEAEFVFQVARDAPSDRLAWSSADATEHIGALHIGIECAGSPFAGINDLGPAVTASDFGNNAGLLTGAEIPHWRDLAWDNMTVEMFIDGAHVGAGAASGLSGGPFAALAFIFTHAAQRGLPLRAGQWISSGAVTGVHAIAAGQTAQADFGALGSLICRAIPAHARGAGAFAANASR